MEDDDPHLGYKKLVAVLFVVSIFSISIVAAAQTPIVEKKKFEPVKKVNIISGYFKPSIKGTGYSYTWHYKSWINRCAYCGHKLLKNPKGVPESELTCSHCDADFDGCSGIVKNGKRNKKLRKA